MWEYRPTPASATELLPLFRDVLEACVLKPDETLLIYGDSFSPPHYAAAVNPSKFVIF